MKKSPWITHSSEYTYQNPWFKVKTSQVTTPGGKAGIYGVIEMAPAVAIIATNERQEFCLIREYRYPHQQWLWEVPIGAIDSKDTDPLRAAQRELLEETGYKSDKWEYIGAMQGIKGLTNQVLYTYLARDITPGKSHIEHDEGIDGQRFISIRDFFEEVRQGVITDEETIAPVAALAAHLRLI
jgi:8-oxo-dGTP pyrophosphatase MutT (NUDIX family)